MPKKETAPHRRATDQPVAAVSEPAPQESEVSIPGEVGEIVITGRRDSSIVRTAPQVVSVLTSVEIARTGEGNIAGAAGNVGPNLDEVKPDYATVMQFVTNGQGAMPSFSGQLSETDIQNVAAYVSQNAGK